MSSSGVLVFLLLGLLGQGESKEDSLEQVLASVGKDVHVVLSERGRNGTTGDNALPDREFDVAGIIENLAEIDVPITLMFGSRYLGESSGASSKNLKIFFLLANHSPFSVADSRPSSPLP